MDTFQLEQQKFLTLIDPFSKYAQAYPLTPLNSIEITNCLVSFFTHHGVPKLIITDNGREFQNTVIKDLMTLHKIDLHFVTPHHPESNSPVERLHSTLIEHVHLLNTQGHKDESIKVKML